MSKRRLSQQQSTRIEKKQKAYQLEVSAYSNQPTVNGLVLSRFGHHVLVESEDGTKINCSTRPGLDLLVAGDKVIWQAEGDKQGVIVSLYPRQTVLGRPNKQGIIKPVAANITQLMIVAAPKPEISWALLDSYLIIAEYLNLNASIVLNKNDLDCNELRIRLTDVYETLGYPVIFTSHQDQPGHKKIIETLDNQISVFVGQSGVGKSSIISRLLPEEENIQTNAISDISELGRHTTSNSCFYHLPSGGGLIDSPGVREFALWHMPLIEIAKGYKEIRPLIGLCKFRNCNHHNTPGCALIHGMQEGLIAKSRYENFIKLSLQFAK